MSLLTHGLGVGALVTAGWGIGLAPVPPPPIPPPPPPIVQPASAGGGTGGGGAGGGGLAWETTELGQLEDELTRLLAGIDINVDVLGDLETGEPVGDLADEDTEEEPEVAAPDPVPEPAPKRRQPSKLARAAKVAVGAGMVYHAGKGVKRAVKAFSDGDLVGVVKALGKAKMLKRLAGSGVHSVLDGLADGGDDDDDKKGR